MICYKTYLCLQDFLYPLSELHIFVNSIYFSTIMAMAFILIVSYASKKATILTLPMLLVMQGLILVRFLDLELTSYTIVKKDGDQRMELKDWGYFVIIEVSCFILGIIVQINSFQNLKFNNHLILVLMGSS